MNFSPEISMPFYKYDKYFFPINVIKIETWILGLFMLFPNDNLSALNTCTGSFKLSEARHFKMESLKYVHGVSPQIRYKTCLINICVWGRCLITSELFSPRSGKMPHD